MDLYANGWIWARSPGEDVVPALVTLRDVPPRTALYVTIAISALTQAVNFQTGVAGFAAAAIRRWQVFNPDGSVSGIDPGPNQMQINSAVIENCASVSFELATQHAEAWGQISVFRL